MIGVLLQLAGELGIAEELLVGVLILARVLPLVFLVPFLGGTAVSPGVRAIVGLALTAVMLPAAGGLGGVSPDMGVYLVLLVKEAIVGVSLGLLGALGFHTLAMAGQVVDRARGAPGLAGPGVLSGSVEGGGPLAALHLQLGVVIFLAVGGHRAFLAAVAGSYDVIPLAQLPLPPGGLREAALAGARLTGAALAAAVMLAAPAVTALLLADLGVGLLGRAAPRLGTWVEALPLRAALGVAVTLLVLALVLDEVGPVLEEATALLSEQAGRLRAVP